MPHSVGSQRVRHDVVTEQQKKRESPCWSGEVAQGTQGGSEVLAFPLDEMGDMGEL